jgi:hypothetical protein
MEDLAFAGQILIPTNRLQRDSVCREKRKKKKPEILYHFSFVLCLFYFSNL